MERRLCVCACTGQKTAAIGSSGRVGPLVVVCWMTFTLSHYAEDRLDKVKRSKLRLNSKSPFSKSTLIPGSLILCSGKVGFLNSWIHFEKRRSQFLLYTCGRWPWRMRTDISPAFFLSFFLFRTNTNTNKKASVKLHTKPKTTKQKCS